LDYPKHLLSVHFIDNSSTDSTADCIRAKIPKLQDLGFSTTFSVCPNTGFGAGHNAAMRAGNAPFCLVTNIDLNFEPDALLRVVSAAQVDDARVAAWELRQKPYEHPKYYDPVTGLTNWNSHACVLLRRSAVESIGGYDEVLFMYGEDVELSYRLRNAGFLLRYCPSAVVFHYSYEDMTKVKPLQYTGSTFANLYLRLKFGHWTDVLAIPSMALRLLMAPEVYAGSRTAVRKNIVRLVCVAPKTLLGRKKHLAHFPFRSWDYEMIRNGAAIPLPKQHGDMPLVTIITRTYRGRDAFLRQALLSVAHQTYSPIEHVVVEDGGESMREVVEQIVKITNLPVRYISLDKVGRSATGNAGLVVASGRWCLFLDDDDLLFADHVETLVSTLRQNPEAAAAYSLSWEVVTGTVLSRQSDYIEISHGLPTVFRQPFNFDVLRHHNFLPIQSVLFERRLFTERGGFDVDMDSLEDWVLWQRYAYNNKFIYVERLTSMHRVPQDPMQIQRRTEAFGAAYPLAISRIDAWIQRQKIAGTQ
jgi:GT2 family glycosyltransferase